MITEYQEESYQPLTVDRSMEIKIYQDDEIIENSISNGYYPLDFDKINSSVDDGSCCKETEIPIILKL